MLNRTHKREKIKGQNSCSIFFCCCIIRPEVHSLTLSKAFKRTRMFQQTHQWRLSPPLNFSVRLVSREEQHSFLKMLHFFMTVKTTLVGEIERSVPGAVRSPVVSSFLGSQKTQIMSSRCENYHGLLMKLFFIILPLSPLIMTLGNWGITRQKEIRRYRYIIINNIFLSQENLKCVTKPKTVSTILNNRH